MTCGYLPTLKHLHLIDCLFVFAYSFPFAWNTFSIPHCSYSTMTHPLRLGSKSILSESFTQMSPITSFFYLWIHMQFYIYISFSCLTFYSEPQRTATYNLLQQKLCSIWIRPFALVSEVLQFPDLPHYLAACKSVNIYESYFPNLYNTDNKQWMTFSHH